MKRIARLYRTGIFVLVPIFVVIALFAWLWDAVYTLSFGNVWVALGLLVLGPFLFGWGISTHWVRSIFLNFCSQIPVISTITQVLFNHEFVEQLKSGQMCEVLVPVSGGGWAPGIAVRKFSLPKDLRDKKSRKVTWVAVLAPATAPVAVTAQIRLYREADVVYTGNSITDATLAFASFGLNMDLNDDKFSIIAEVQSIGKNKNPPG